MIQRAFAATLSIAIISNAPCQAFANTISAPTQAGSNIVVVPGRNMFSPLSPEQSFGLGQGFMDMQSVSVLPTASSVKAQSRFQGSAVAAPVSQGLKASPVATANVPMSRQDQLKDALAPAQAGFEQSVRMSAARSVLPAADSEQPAQQEEAKSEGTAVKLGTFYDGSKLDGLQSAADPVPATGGTLRTLLSKAKGSASVAKQGITRFLGQGKQLLIRFKRTTVISVGGLNIEAVVTDEEILQELKKVGMEALSVAPGRIYRVLFDDKKGNAAGWAAQMEGHPYVLYATPFDTAVPVWNELTLTFRKSVIVRGGDINFESSVMEDDMASILRKHALTVLESLSDRSFRVAVPLNGDAEKTMAALSHEAMVAQVAMRRGAALLHKVYKAVDWFAGKATLLVLAASILADKFVPILSPYILSTWAIALGIALFERAIHNPYGWYRVTAGAMAGFVVSLAAVPLLGILPAMLLGAAAGVLAVLAWRFLQALARER
ncbi:MAG: hypothetical protein WC728_12915 [Elusimicrobiota bacterium]